MSLLNQQSSCASVLPASHSFPSTLRVDGNPSQSSVALIDDLSFPTRRLHKINPWRRTNPLPQLLHNAYLTVSLRRFHPKYTLATESGAPLSPTAARSSFPHPGNFLSRRPEVQNVRTTEHKRTCRTKASDINQCLLNSTHNYV